MFYDDLANPKAGPAADKMWPVRHAELFDKAVSRYQQAISPSPDNYMANFNWGLMYYNEAARIRPAHPSPRKTAFNERVDPDTSTDIQRQNFWLKKAFPYSGSFAFLILRKSKNR